MDYRNSWEALKETIGNWIEEEQDDNVIDAFVDILDRMEILEASGYHSTFLER